RIVRDVHAGERSEDVGDRLQRDVLAVRHAPTDPRLRNLPQELADEAALADARFPDQGRDLNAGTIDRTAEEAPKFRELSLAADERRCDGLLLARRPLVLHAPQADRRRFPFHDGGLQLIELEQTTDRALGG